MNDGDSDNQAAPPDQVPAPVAAKLPAVRYHGAVTAGAVALGAMALGTLALGAIAVGRMAIGKLTVRQLGLERARLRSGHVNELRVARLVIEDLHVLRQ